MDDVSAIKCGLLIDGTGHEPTRDVVVLIEDSEIVEVSEGLSTPQGVKVIDASGKTVMPGLVDGHVHLNMDFESRSYPLHRLAPDSLLNLIAAKNARISLEAGVTSILGSCGYGNYADLFLKEAIDRSWIPGPRLLTSGPGVRSTHRSGTNIRYGLPQHPYEMADGVEGLKKLIRTHVGMGVDWIKVYATYDIGSPNSEPHMRNLDFDELQEIVDEAHSQQKKVKAHLLGREATKDALNAGIDILLHGFFLDEDDAEYMKKKNITLMPTLAWMGEIIRISDPYHPKWYLQRAKQYTPHHLESFKTALEAGVRIAAGSDCSDEPKHGENAMELEYLVRNGLTPMEALVAGTMNVAEAFGCSHLLGTIEPKKLADIIIVNGDPLKDITILQEKNRIETVIKNGKIVVETGLMKT